AGQKFADIFHQCAKGPGSFGIGGVVTQEVAVLFEVRATACRIDDKCVAGIVLEDINIVPCELAPAFALPSVDMERSAALLADRCDNLATIDGQHANGGLVDVAIHLVHDAAADKANAVTPGANGGCNFGQWFGKQLATGPGHQ